MKISVIIPVYNTEEYLDKCLASVLNQTYRDIEVICIDDGSTDNSRLILEEFAKTDNRVMVIHKLHEGISSARNEGLRYASGDWIAFVDSDDYLAIDMYSRMLSNKNSLMADIISCGYYMDFGDKYVRRENKKKIPDMLIDAGKFLRYMYQRDIYSGVCSYVWLRLFSRKVLYENNSDLKILFAKDIDCAEDAIFMAEAMMQAENILYIDKPLYYYVQRESSVVHDLKGRLENLSWLTAYQRIIEFYQKHNVNQEVMSYVIRMYIYMCGKFMENAILYTKKDVFYKVRTWTLEYKEVYEKTNIDYPERIQWINELINYKWEVKGI